jgi:hypothetical protein
MGILLITSLIYSRSFDPPCMLANSPSVRTSHPAPSKRRVVKKMVNTKMFLLESEPREIVDFFHFRKFCIGVSKKNYTTERFSQTASRRKKMINSRNFALGKSTPKNLSCSVSKIRNGSFQKVIQRSVLF